MENPKVTISVPVYNTKQYLATCLDSLINQTLKDIEIIIVDDGSTDGSGEICDEYAKKDNRIKVFHKENGGLASARQVGLDNTTGEYYTVCDSDDWVELNLYEKLYNKAIEDDYDMTYCDIYFNYEKGYQSKHSCHIPKLDKDSLIRDALAHKITMNTFNRIYKTELFKKYGISYEPGINQGEDSLIFKKQILHPIHIGYINEPLYHYRRIINGNSYTNNLTKKSIEQIEFIRNWEKENFDENKFGEELFIGRINLAFAAIRAKDMDNIYYKKINNQYLKIKHFVKYKKISLKIVIVLISKISFSLSKWICQNTYKYFYE